MELYEVTRTTSAVRHFTNDPLPDEMLYTILTTRGSPREAATGRVHGS